MIQVSQLQYLEQLLAARGVFPVVAANLLPKAIDEVEAWARQTLVELDQLEEWLTNPDAVQQYVLELRGEHLNDQMLMMKAEGLELLLQDPEAATAKIASLRIFAQRLLGSEE
jgi:hypothetical protein